MYAHVNKKNDCYSRGDGFRDIPKASIYSYGRKTPIKHYASHLYIPS